jgi:glycosyltransferase involved in cell wall biosynthesis
MTRSQLGLRVIPSRLESASLAAWAAGDSHPARPTAHATRRRWSINGDFVALAPTGVARYAREVTLALDRLVEERHPLTLDLELDIVAPGEGRDPLALRALALRIVPEFGTPRVPQVWVQMQLPRHVPGGLLSFCNLAPIVSRRHIACIHDLHTRLMPESYGRLFRLAHRVILPIVGRRAAAITTVSQLSRRHLGEFGIAPPEKVEVTYNGSDHVERWDVGRSILAHGPRRPFVLCLGRRQHYKNTGLMLRLAPILDGLGLELWMAGEVDDTMIAALAAERPGNLRLLGRISDDDFKWALSKALCFVFPSRVEGFGLPAIEAMACGCPVIASTAPCLPEVCGPAALYAGPDDPLEWAAQVARLQAEAVTRARLIEAGRERARRYSWRGVAETYLRLMLQVDLR